MGSRASLEFHSKDNMTDYTWWLIIENLLYISLVTGTRTLLSWCIGKNGKLENQDWASNLTQIREPGNMENDFMQCMLQHSTYTQHQYILSVDEIGQAFPRSMTYKV